MQEKFKNLLDKRQTENRKKSTQIEEMKTQAHLRLSFSVIFSSHLVTRQ